MLLRPDPYPYESLESYLIRLADLYEYTPKQLIERFNIILEDSGSSLPGALPSNLSQINPYHASITSTKRMACLGLLAEKMCKGRLPILELAVSRADGVTYSQSYEALSWHAFDIPRAFFREKVLPICPQCVEKQAYIPQFWHLFLVKACPVHQCVLIERCPSCKEPLNYITQGNIEGCQCGLAYKDMGYVGAEPELCKLAATIMQCAGLSNTSDNLLYQQQDIHQIYGAILWYFAYLIGSPLSGYDFPGQALLQCIHFFEKWPAQLEKVLEHKAIKGLEVAHKQTSETAFSELFDSMIQKSSRLPERSHRDNPIVREVFAFFYHLYHQAEHCLHELQYLLLSAIEAAILLDTTERQIARLVEEGLLKPRRQLKGLPSLNVYQPNFRLGDLIAVWESRLQSRRSNRHFYLSRW